ncbi:MAG: hypothetical protein U9R16_01915 [Campylobacterota bacterium]|nr:hypothetical protein [Campylobacterota bacterium]
MKYEVNEKTKRLRYIRMLEKFTTKSVGLLKYDNFDLELYKKAMLRSYEDLKKIEALDLYQEYPSQLKNLAQLILNNLDSHSKTYEDERKAILKESNLLYKLKNNNRYKKDKHKNKKFTDGY